MNLRDHLRAIYDERGELTPALVVEAATEEDHPLHKRFEWDDSEAARKYRLVQAGDLIREAKVVYRTDDQQQKATRAFVAVRETETVAANYIPTEEAAMDDIAYRIVLRDFERAVARLTSQYAHLKEFRDVLTGALKRAS